ncbi:hypothetical protein OG453_38030 [Streptomyces sp. NBC_01381]|uniref:hypothetical protein n=1 Tax=Streptomyces sp. NBC_01381 TaxID=2903845 RepID=UPI002251C5E9|nr:hypothetical protein [Streptomyces sp. NBC_01381]MCX4672393.1 hypothetical protein [Streptomyces sp. NBC_01381]
MVAHAVVAVGVAIGQFLIGEGVEELSRIENEWVRKRSIDGAIEKITARHGAEHRATYVHMLCKKCMSAGWARELHKRNHKKKKKNRTKYCRCCGSGDWPYSAFKK